MKKTISLLLLALILCLFAGCSENKNKGEDTSSVQSGYVHSTNILAYAQKGEIPEAPFNVGDDIDAVKEGFKDTIPEGSEIDDLIITEGNLTVQMDGGSWMFFYEKANASAGVGVVVAREEAFKLSMGGVYSAEDVIDMIGTDDYKRGKATDADVFFLPGDSSAYECLSFTAGDYILKFILLDGYVSAVTITNPLVWNY